MKPISLLSAIAFGLFFGGLWGYWYHQQNLRFYKMDIGYKEGYEMGVQDERMRFGKSVRTEFEKNGVIMCLSQFPERLMPTQYFYCPEIETVAKYEPVGKICPSLSELMVEDGISSEEFR